MATRRHLSIVTDTSSNYGGHLAQGLSGEIVHLVDGMWSVLVCEDATTITLYTECNVSTTVTLDSGSIIYFHAPDAAVSVDKGVFLNHVGVDVVGRSVGSSTIIKQGFIGVQ